ncbi:SH3 domain-containing protein 21 [Megalops cyprinoides]|uniref:SH3 domain-containing protein 21 n=1 Tax=Megalops cyprinoides TaxID=118141 RepID=UPI001864B896|nr:SH3 domain-containing protein 21 [Megalops cyprinoides]
MEVLVLIDFEGNMRDEMTIHVGDVVKNVTKATEEGWLEGELRGKRGIFPAHFVKEVPVYLVGDSKREPRSLRKSKVAKQTRKCEVAYAYTPINDDELELAVGETIEIIKEIEDGWWMGLKNGKIGAFPSNFVKEIFVTPKDAKVNEGKSRPKLSEAVFSKEIKPQQQRASVRNKVNTVKECCQVMFDYTAVTDDELNLKKGDVVTIITKETEDEGWWEGELNGQRGFFPDNFVMVIPTDTFQPGSGSQPPMRRGTERHSVKAEASPMDKKTPEHSSSDPASKSDAKDEKTDSKDLRSDPPNKVMLPGMRKAPPPPVKDKPHKFLPNKTNGDPPCSSPKHTEDKSKEKEVDQLDGVEVSSAKLSHPTANRAKPPHRRPPSTLAVGPQDSENHLSSPTRSEQPFQLPKLSSPLKPVAPKPGAEPKPDPKPEVKPDPKPDLKQDSKPDSKLNGKPGLKGVQENQGSTEDLRAEVRELSMALELLKNRHQSDIEELKEELREERAKRMALQDEVQLLKKTIHH